ncbi:hypothetical protein CPC16_003177 [Podila verticillata]|nr:hypothetical protein CPC16_003177 [Podila verticillata]
MTVNLDLVSLTSGQTSGSKGSVTPTKHTKSHLIGVMSDLGNKHLAAKSWYIHCRILLRAPSAPTRMLPVQTSQQLFFLVRNDADDIDRFGDSIDLLNQAELLEEREDEHVENDPAPKDLGCCADASLEYHKVDVGSLE